MGRGGSNEPNSRKSPNTHRRLLDVRTEQQRSGWRRGECRGSGASHRARARDEVRPRRGVGALRRFCGSRRVGLLSQVRPHWPRRRACLKACAITSSRERPTTRTAPEWESCADALASPSLRRDFRRANPTACSSRRGRESRSSPPFWVSVGERARASSGKAGGCHQRLLDWMGVARYGARRRCRCGVSAHRMRGGGGSRGWEYLPRPPSSRRCTPSATSSSPKPAGGAPSSFGDSDDASSPSVAPDAATSSAAESANAHSDAIVIGSLDGLEGMQPFSLGFVAAPLDVRPRIAKWKQASSICSPAPSQRAALWALGVRP